MIPKEADGSPSADDTGHRLRKKNIKSDSI